MSTSKRYEEALGSALERANALSSARWAWYGLMALGLVATGLVMALIKPSMAAMNAWAYVFLAVSVLWLVVMVPVVFILRGHCLQAAWRDRPIDPDSYVRGLMTIWGTLETVWLLSIAGVAASQMLLPSALPGVVAFMLLAMTGPSPKALALRD